MPQAMEDMARFTPAAYSHSLTNPWYRKALNAEAQEKALPQ